MSDKNELNYKIYTTNLTFPEDLSNLAQINHLKSTDSIPSIRLIIKLEEEEINIDEIRNKEIKGHGNYSYEINPVTSRGYSAVNAYIEYLLEIYVINMLKNVVIDDDFNLKRGHIIGMANEGKITLNSSPMLNYDNYFNTFKRVRPSRDSPERSSPSRVASSRGRSTRRSDSHRGKIMSDSTHSRSFDPLVSLSTVVDDDLISRLLKDGDLNHYQKLYLLFCIFYSFKTKGDISPIYFVNGTRETKVELEYDSIKKILKSNSNAPSNYSELMTEYLNRFSTTKYRSISKPISANSSSGKRTKRKNKEIILQE